MIIISVKHFGMEVKMKASLTACSNPVSSDQRENIKRLITLLEKEGLKVVTSPYLFGCHENSPERSKAKDLMEYFRDSEMDFIFDISGGDIANSILPELDYEVIRKSRAVFCGYSDLTTLLNAIYTKTGCETMNYQIRNLLYGYRESEMMYFREHILKSVVTEADLEYQLLQGDTMKGIVLGGNIRCFLKLAGTPFWPDLSGAILMLESYRGGVMQMTTLLHQLKQIGVFEQINGILLGTFSAMEDEQLKPTIAELVQEIVPRTLPIAVTRYIGHRTDARAIVIGREYALGKAKMLNFS